MKLEADAEGRIYYDPVKLLYAAVKENRPESAETMLDRHPELLTYDVDSVEGQTWMHLAAKFDASNVIDLLYHRGLSPSAEDVYGRYPLHIAIYSENIKAVHRLITCGVDTSKQLGGRDALHSAIEQDKWRPSALMTRTLLNTGRVDIESKVGGQTPLYRAAFFGYEGVVKALLESGADTGFVFERKTPLRIAKIKKHDAIVALLELWISAQKAGKAIDKVSSGEALGIKPLSSWSRP